MKYVIFTPNLLTFFFRLSSLTQHQHGKDLVQECGEIELRNVRENQLRFHGSALQFFYRQFLFPPSNVTEF